MCQLQHFYIFVDELLLPLGRKWPFLPLRTILNWHASDSTLPQCHTGGRGMLAPSFLTGGHDLTSHEQLLGLHRTPCWAKREWLEFSCICLPPIFRDQARSGTWMQNTPEMPFPGVPSLCTDRKRNGRIATNSHWSIWCHRRVGAMY